MISNKVSEVMLKRSDKTSLSTGDYWWSVVGIDGTVCWVRRGVSAEQSLRECEHWLLRNGYQPKSSDEMEDVFVLI